MSGLTRLAWFWVTQALSAARVVLSFLFVVLSPVKEWWHVVAIIYVAALSTDLVDGWLARAKHVASQIGGAIDGFGDRYFSVLSLLYAATRGISLAVIAIILLRDLYAVSVRAVLIDGRSFMYSNSRITGLILTMIGVSTLNLLVHPAASATIYYQAPYAAAALFQMCYLICTLAMSWGRLVRVIDCELEEARPGDTSAARPSEQDGK